ncbi:putative methyltransferase [Streptomyces lydicamycinicus]|uniref:Putative methyltransferase n=1 Tax=Streptomyces lydicamycinicus TaxID=1546107 RepID=A0A0P4RBM1_9ACTN|nr:putative methyltransferase [Streptomyces lydicamycinicus]
MGSRVVGHSRIGLDAEHGAAGGLKLAGCDAGSAADVEHVRPGAPGDDPRYQRIGVAGPGLVVALRVHAERLGHPPGRTRLRRGRFWLLSR